MEVQNLHFLVHPDYFLSVKGHIAPDAKTLEEANKDFRPKIDSLGEEDVLIIFSPLNRPHLTDLREEREWTRYEKYARKKLSRRAIILSNPEFLPAFDRKRYENRAPTLEIVAGILKAREFEVNEDTPCEVWGN